jgi:hypothetical protein
MGKAPEGEKLVWGLRVAGWLRYYHALSGKDAKAFVIEDLGLPYTTAKGWLDYREHSATGRPTLDAMFALYERLHAPLDQLFTRTPTDADIERARRLPGEGDHKKHGPAAPDHPRVGGRQKRTARG